MQHILVGIDFSPQTESVLGTALDLARALRAELTLLHVAAPDPDFVGLRAGPQHERDDRASELRTAHHELREMAKRIESAGITAHALLVRGATAERIREEALRLKADLIVVGSHGRGAFARALLGSTSAGVLRDAHRPVLVVPRQAH